MPVAEDEQPMEESRRLTRLALVLVGATLAWNVVEAVVAVWAGVEAESIALFGFGLDSVIETLASAVVLWRFAREAGGASPEAVERSERRVQKVVGTTFFLLAAYVVVVAVRTLWRADVAEASPVGIVLAALSLLVMPGLAWAKLRVAARLESASLRAEAKETLACAWLSFALLLGLGLNALAGWWWADPVAALVMVPWLVREGREAFEGGCCGEACTGEEAGR